jgi:uncharacterized protein (TIGR00251 family)
MPEKAGSSLDGLLVKESEGFCTFAVRLTPRSARNRIIGVKDGKLLLKIQAPPVEGEANECVIEFLAELLDISKNDVQLFKGHHSREKVLKVIGLRAGQIIQAVQKESK